MEILSFAEGPGKSFESLPRLSLATLASVPKAYRADVDPRSLPVRMVHLGIGAFHRAHQAAFTQDAVAISGEPWGICGVSQRSGTVAAQLGPQDGLYSLTERAEGSTQLKVMAVVREVLSVREAPENVLARLANASTSVVTLTVTEKGYCRDPATGRLRLEDPGVMADLSGRAPSTVLGQLAEGLARRARSDAGAVTIISCDNLPANGKSLESLFFEYAARRPDGGELVAWAQDHVAFPSCVVDRIAPAPTDGDRLRAAQILGLRDEGAVVAEPFRQWVIEDRFAGARPAWELAGATLTDDAAPYERIKLRLLNGAHSMMAYLGALAGYELVHEVARGPIGQVAERMMAVDAAPTLDVPEGFHLAAYERALMERFQNPVLGHRTLQVAMDGSQKLPQRLLGTIADRRAQGGVPLFACLGVAAWIRFVSSRRSDVGQPLTVDDPLAERVANVLEGCHEAKAVVDALLGLREVFTEELTADNVVREVLADLVARLEREGAERTARAMAC